MLVAAYITLFIVLFSIILAAYNSALKKVAIAQPQRQKRIGKVILVMGVWVLYVAGMASTNFFQNLSLPPRIPLFLILPLFSFTAIFLYRNRKNPILHAVPKSWPVYYQSFRMVIEVLFVLTFMQGLIPQIVTFEGYNYEIVLAATAPIIAYLAFSKKIISEKMVLAWNFVGIGTVLFAAFLFISSYYFPSVWGATESFGSTEFARFPFILLPGFFMPSAVFFHLFSITQILNSAPATNTQTIKTGNKKTRINLA